MTKSANNLMIVGTGSTVGKSVLCAALCRIFTQDGYDVTPFKSQNMSLNSFITADGKEMGRAQVMQAECANKAPDARMNPILLKPTSESRSQIIFCGKVYATQDAATFYQTKDRLRASLQGVYDEIASECDLVILEGAGSPAEINLKENDLVNMGMAKMAQAPTLLIGDIDKGGVFASLYGTIMLLDEDERALIKGLIINKFRGDISLLEPGLRQIEELTGIPVVGVIPWFDLQLEDEDSVVDFGAFQKKLPAYPNLDPKSTLDIAVIQIPYMSNFTDLNALALEPGVCLRFVRPEEALGIPDIIVIPGCKSTIYAANVLRECGAFSRIKTAKDNGSHIVGICGGYQILGTRIDDPLHSESDLDSCPGLGLLDVATIFSDEKTMERSAGIDSLFGERLEGYEIHMGEQVWGDTARRFLTLHTSNSQDMAYDGALSADGRVLGSYFHGLFDNGRFTRRYLNAVRLAKNCPAYEGEFIDYQAFKNEQYDKLATHVRKHIDMDTIREIIDKGVI